MSRGMLLAQRAVDPTVEAEHHPSTAKRDQRDDPPFTRLESNGCARGDVQPATVRRLAIEYQPLIDLEEVKVRADLNWPVGEVLHLHFNRAATRVERDGAGCDQHLAGRHGIGSCTVTSLVPSGNVA